MRANILVKSGNENQGLDVTTRTFGDSKRVQATRGLFSDGTESGSEPQ
jgi:hypothetical protein